MKIFTEILESKRKWNEITIDDLRNFVSKIKNEKSVSREYMRILQLCIQNNILSGEDLDEKIFNGNSGDLKKLERAKGYNLADMVEIQKLAKTCKAELKGLPQIMSSEDYNDVISGKRELADITLDLETERGRNRCAEQYSPLVLAIARKYEHSGMDYDMLVSSGYEGLLKAMSDYHRPDEYVDVEDGLDNDQKKEVKKAKGLTFKQYAGWRIKFQILNDLNNLSRTVKISQYQYEKNKAAGNTKGNFNTVSIDLTVDDEGSTLLDRMIELSSNSNAFSDRSANKQWEKVYKTIDDNFSAKHASIFYRYFGLNNYKQMKGTEIAKELGVTGALVSGVVKNIMNFLKNDKKVRDILRDLLDLYTESLMINTNPQQLSETMLQDDIFIMLCESTRWSNPKVFNNSIGEALEYLKDNEREEIIKCLEQGIDYIDNIFDDKRNTIVCFLESLYPTQCIYRKSNIELIEMMNELSENHHEHNMSK